MQSNCNIRPATQADLPTLLEIFDLARAFMRRTGNPNQWAAGYPAPELLLAEIARGTCYVCEAEGKVQATFCLIPGEDPTYRVIEDGAWPSDAPYSTIHRMASRGEVPGMAAACFAWAAARGGELRADTHADNKVMQHVLERAGFVRCGRIYLANGSPRLAYWRAADPA